jgi:peptidoglycan/LPS O-acetylase OafA/YrhL
MNDYGKDVIFAFLTIIMVFSLSMLLSQNKILEFLGKNSLVIFAFQEPTYRAVIYVFSKILNSDVEIVRNNIYYSFAIYITTILIIIPAIAIYNNKINPLLKKI